MVISEQDVVAAFLEGVDGFQAVACFVDVVTCLPQNHANERPNIIVVLNNEHPLAVPIHHCRTPLQA